MKLMLSIFIMVISLGAFAESGWICVGETESDVMKLKQLKLGKEFFLSDIQVLTINEKYCALPHVMIYAGVCHFKGHTLSVGIGSQSEGITSELLTKKGKKISLFCEVDGTVGPVGVGGGSN